MGSLPSMQQPELFENQSNRPSLLLKPFNGFCCTKNKIQTPCQSLQTPKCPDKT